MIVSLWYSVLCDSFRIRPSVGTRHVVTQARRVRRERIHPTASVPEHGLMAVFFGLAPSCGFLAWLGACDLESLTGCRARLSGIQGVFRIGPLTDESCTLSSIACVRCCRACVTFGVAPYDCRYAQGL